MTSQKKQIDLISALTDYYNQVNPEVKETAIRQLKEHGNIRFKEAFEEALLN